MIANLLFCSLLLSNFSAAASQPQNRITLPLEVAGAAGSTVSATVFVPSDGGVEVHSLWMRIHGLGFADMVSVRINNGDWTPLNNSTVSVTEPGKSYGGIGGGFATLEMTLALPAATVTTGQKNRLYFRFNHTDGVVSAFRVLGFDFLTSDGRRLLPPETFVQEDPNTWTPPSSDPDQISTGHCLWQTAQLIANALPGAQKIQAHCGDCHPQDGRDLKYFNFSNRSIIARSQFHGLSEQEGRQIASYIRSLSVPNPGQPWNPPFQPGPGLDAAQPAANWSAGAGLSWVLEKDSDTLPFLFGRPGSSAELTVTPAAFRPDADLNPRTIPIAMQLPDWNHWLPRVHPIDAWGERFSRSTFAKTYMDLPQQKLTGSLDQSAFFDAWVKSRNKFLLPHLTPTSSKWTPELGNAFYSTQLWQLVKTWEIMQTAGYDSPDESRSWPNTVPAATAPSDVHIPDGPSGMGGRALTNEYYSNAWYEVQLLVNSGDHRHHDRSPVDWLYLAGHVLDLQQRSARAEPGRLLVMIIKALQSSDPQLGPASISEGWRPDQTIDPRIMVSDRWEPVFREIPGSLRQAITESFLTAWLDKTLEYAPVSYFQLGLSAASYQVPPEFRDITGGKVWEAEPRFRTAGVTPETTLRLEHWGKAQLALAQLFHY